MTRTRAIDQLTRAGVPHRVLTYPADRVDGRLPYGEAVARLLGLDPRRVFKTLVARVDGEPVVAIVPADSRLSTKALARAAGGKRAELASPADAERLTGYVTGGISPFGQRRRLPVYVDRSVMDDPVVYVSGGARGLQLQLASPDLVGFLGASVAPLT
ncbi:MAG: Cys-tRNA(Pro)/Cys-tRNA(Cys) deacylase [Acidimicrobiia bacterium]|nr:MAG: Cys-tRNA(Pro)/Cys-tRNA(Cys) deacylase [Acidimicrobiia bacterium]